MALTDLRPSHRPSTPTVKEKVWPAAGVLKLGNSSPQTLGKRVALQREAKQVPATAGLSHVYLRSAHVCPEL